MLDGTRGVGRATWWSRGGLCLALIVGAPGARAAEEPVVNHSPQRTVDPIEATYPLYHPAFFTAPAVFDPERPPAEVLLTRLRDLHSAGRYTAALPEAHRLIAAAPDHPIGYYNLACVLSRLRRSDEALDALDRAVARGWRHERHVLIDFDLEPIRDDPRFRRSIERMRELRRSEQPAARALRDDAWTEIAAELERAAPMVLSRYHIPGVSVALFDRDGVVWRHAFGTTSRLAPAPMTDRTLFASQTPAQLIALIAVLQHPDGARRLERSFQAMLELESAPLAAAPPGRAVRRVTPTSHHETSRVPGWARAANARGGSRHPALDLFGMLETVMHASGESSLDEQIRVGIIEPLAAASNDFLGPAVNLAEICPGHTGLGTTLTPPDLPRAGWMAITAADLGLVVSALMEGRLGADTADRFREAVGGEDLPPGLMARRARTANGSMIEIAGEAAGCGCLIRWSERARRGVVIFYNAQPGRSAAEHLARVALGG